MQKTWNADKQGPAVWIDGGNFAVFDSKQESETSELIVQAMADMRYAAVNLGPSELVNYSGPFERYLFPASLPYVSANVRFHDTGERPFPAYRVVEVPVGATSGLPPEPLRTKPPVTLRIAIIGVADNRNRRIAFGPGGRSLILTDPATEILEVLPKARQDADLVIVAAAGDQATADQILLRSPEIDAILVGTDHVVWKEPRSSGRTKVFISGDRGRELVRVAIDRAEKGYELAFENIHLGETTVPEDPDVARVVEAAVTRFNEESRELMKVAAASHPPPDIAPYIGALKCAECHVRQYEIWSASKHAHAFQTLVDAKRDYTKICTLCHVTGYGSDVGGGFVDPASTPQMTDVQCEACHGPAAEHIKDPKASYGAMETPRACRGCHDPQNSAAFDYTTYWAQIAH